MKYLKKNPEFLSTIRNKIRPALADELRNKGTTTDGLMNDLQIDGSKSKNRDTAKKMV